MSPLSSRPLALPLAVATLALGLLAPAPAAEACGGFFCSNSSPVMQQGERILFAVEGTHVEAHIQITYAGPSEHFSWVLPLPSVPELGVGTDVLFSTLHNVTDPRFAIEWKEKDDCYFSSGCYAFADADGAEAAPGAGGGDDQSVQVLAAGSVGPYDYKVVEGGGAPLFEWLNDNGYDQPPTALPIVSEYADMDFKFLALKLQKDADDGDIQPLVISYEAPTLACVPLKLTSIAALADMPVWTWVLAKSRAVPLNYFHVLLNPKAYDWLNCGVDAKELGWGWFWQPNQQYCQEHYMGLVTAAADMANGHGFVTEYAGLSAVMDDRLYVDDQYDVASLAASKTPGQFLQNMMGQGIPNTQMTRNIIKDHIPKPADEELPQECQGDQGFYAIWNIDNCIQYMPEGWTFDPNAFAADVDTRILKPMAHAQALFEDHDYMTRLFSTISPDEMTRDPIFSFNPELPDVASDHIVHGEAFCPEGEPWKAEKITISWPDGGSTSWEGEFESCWMDLPMPEAGADAAAGVQILGEMGGPIAVPFDEVEEKDQEFDDVVMPLPNQSVVDRERDRNVDPIPNTGTFPDEPVDNGPSSTESPNDGGTGGPGANGDPSSEGAASVPEEKLKSQGCHAGHSHDGAPITPLLFVVLALFVGATLGRRTGRERQEG